MSGDAQHLKGVKSPGRRAMRMIRTYRVDRSKRAKMRADRKLMEQEYLERTGRPMSSRQYIRARRALRREERAQSRQKAA